MLKNYAAMLQCLKNALIIVDAHIMRIDNVIHEHTHGLHVPGIIAS